jgi:hypothetical protein
LLKLIFENIDSDGCAGAKKVIEKIRNFYIDRVENCLLPDYEVDERIANIQNSDLQDVFNVMKAQPFKYINEKGY